MPRNRSNPALPPDDGTRVLTPAEKARQLGVTTDTLRRWENEGRIESTRTAGGQRRYRESDRPIDARHSIVFNEPSTSNDAEDRKAETSAPGTAVPHWLERIEERRADVEIAKLDREYQAILREEGLQRDERRRRREQEQKQAEVERREEEAAQLEKQRLERLVQQGMLIALLAPFDYQAVVKRELLAYVTPQNFPPQLSAIEVSALLTKKVEQILKPVRDKQRIVELIQEARSFASISTMGSEWDYEPAQEARREVDRQVRRDVDASWNNEDVRALVTEILDEWQ